MKDSRSRAAWPWFAVGILLMYAVVTLGVAIAATPPKEPNALFGGFYRAAASWAQELLGAGVWPRLIDMHGSLGGVFPTPMAFMLVLALFSFAALARGRSIRDQRRDDVRIARDEAIREQVRRGQRTT